MIAEITWEVNLSRGADKASMRPRSDDRGNVADAVHGRGQILASMRPRSDDRGNFDQTREYMAIGALLQ